MKSVGAQIKQLAAMLGTQDLNQWERGFVENVSQQTRNGDDTRDLSELQIGKVEQVYQRHFGD